MWLFWEDEGRQVLSFADPSLALSHANTSRLPSCSDPPSPLGEAGQKGEVEGEGGLTLPCRRSLLKPPDRYSVILPTNPQDYMVGVTIVDQ